MKNIEELTKKELIEIVVDDQIKRGIVKLEKREFQINARLKGLGSLRPEPKSAYINYIKECLIK